MTIEELATLVDQYFALHLDSSYWGQLSIDIKMGAISMASSDIFALVPRLSMDTIQSGSAAIKAIAEQAVFLSRNYDQIQEGKVLTSESVEGISAGYTLIGSSFGLSSRASSYIDQAKRENMGSTIRIVRG